MVKEFLEVVLFLNGLVLSLASQTCFCIKFKKKIRVVCTVYTSHVPPECN